MKSLRGARRFRLAPCSRPAAGPKWSVSLLPNIEPDFGSGHQIQSRPALIQVSKRSAAASFRGASLEGKEASRTIWSPQERGVRGSGLGAGSGRSGTVSGCPERTAVPDSRIASRTLATPSGWRHSQSHWLCSLALDIRWMISTASRRWRFVDRRLESPEPPVGTGYRTVSAAPAPEPCAISTNLRP